MRSSERIQTGESLIQIGFRRQLGSTVDTNSITCAARRLARRNRTEQRPYRKRVSAGDAPIRPRVVARVPSASLALWEWALCSALSGSESLRVSRFDHGGSVGPWVWLMGTDGIGVSAVGVACRLSLATPRQVGVALEMSRNFSVPTWRFCTSPELVTILLLTHKMLLPISH